MKYDYLVMIKFYNGISHDQNKNILRSVEIEQQYSFTVLVFSIAQLNVYFEMNRELDKLLRCWTN